MVGSAQLSLLAKIAISQHLNAGNSNNPRQKLCLGITSTPQIKLLGGSLAPPPILLRGGSLAPPKFASDGGATAHPAPPTTVRQRAATGAELHHAMRWARTPLPRGVSRPPYRFHQTLPLDFTTPPFYHGKSDREVVKPSGIPVPLLGPSTGKW